MSGEGLRLSKYLTLLALPGVGRVTLARCLASGGEAWLDQDLEVLAGQLKGSLIPDAAGLARAKQEAAAQQGALAALGITPLFQGSPGYPGGLKRLAEPPRLIFARGQGIPDKAVAVIGTRHPGAWGLAQARAYAAALARAGIPVLNGLALGVDEAALETALVSGGSCVGVLASGHDVLGRGGDLARRILSEKGCLVSEYAPGVAAHKGSFIERDRIQAGLSAAVLVVESGVDGGTMHTARAAKEAGVPLFALLPDEAMALAEKDEARLEPGLLGAWSLIRSGAAVRMDSPARFLETVGA